MLGVILTKYQQIHPDSTANVYIFVYILIGTPIVPLTFVVMLCVFHHETKWLVGYSTVTVDTSRGDQISVASSKTVTNLEVLV